MSFYLLFHLLIIFDYNSAFISSLYQYSSNLKIRNIKTSIISAISMSNINDENCSLEADYITFPPVVTNRNIDCDEFLKDLEFQLKTSLSFFPRSNDEIEFTTLVGRVDPSIASSIMVIDQTSIKTRSHIEALRDAGAIYLMHEDEEINEDARNACLFDHWVPSSSSIMSSSSKSTRQSSINRLIHLFEKLRLKTNIKKDNDILVDAGEWSHFVSLTFPSIDKALPSLQEIRKGADAWELRVDLLDDYTPKSLHRQIALLRDVASLPIVFTVRSKGQIGNFVDDPKLIFPLLQEGLRAGAEWVDVEACWSNDIILEFCKKATTNPYGHLSRLLGSIHVTVPQTNEQVEALYNACDLKGCADMLKVVTGANNDNDCKIVHEAGTKISNQLNKPYIGLCLGDAGSLSRVMNKRFTPVNHRLMATAAPGQLSASELMIKRVEKGLLKEKQFFLFGKPIKQSLSPSMHNAAFETLLLPHQYGLLENEDVYAYESVIKSDLFGGASVTIPHKETIMPLLNEIRGAAVDIGAVNTILIENGQLIGQNTDWIGINRPLRQRLQKRGWDGTGVGLVIGAGGTARAACYAIKDLGLHLVVTNRSPEKGKELAKKFGGRFIPIDKLNTLHSLAVVVSTVPAAAEFTLPSNLLDHPIQRLPVVLDVVYKPAMTKLMQQAGTAGCERVQGATMLLEQGIEQFEIWNRRKAPRAVMHKAIFSGLEEL